MPANPEDLDAGLAPKKSSSPIVPLLAVIILVPALVYGVMDFVILPKLKGAGASNSEEKASQSSSASKPQAHVPGLKETPVEFASLVVNLSGSGGTRYLRTTIVVASSDSKLGDYLKEHEAPLKDAAITILSAQTPESIETAAGKDIIRRQLIRNFNNILGEDAIGSVYFKEFVVQ